MTSLVEQNRFRNTTVWRLWAVVLLATFVAVAGFGVAVAQDAGDLETVTDAAPDVAPADDIAEDAAAAEQAAADDVAVAQPRARRQVNLEGFAMLALVIALFVVPMFIGNRFAKSLKMPDHGWKFSAGDRHLGGGGGRGVLRRSQIRTRSKRRHHADLRIAGRVAARRMRTKTPTIKAIRLRSDIVDRLIVALAERVDPSGTKEVTIRKYGAGQIEIIIPEASQQELEYIERRISTAGALEFRITASRNFAAHRRHYRTGRAITHW